MGIVKKCVPCNPQTKLTTMLNQKVGNCFIQEMQPINQKKRNHIKMLAPAEVDQIDD